MNVDSTGEMYNRMIDTTITSDLVRSVCQNDGALQQSDYSLTEECELGSCRWFAACQTFCFNGFLYRE
jgi:hypothetical protein